MGGFLSGIFFCFHNKFNTLHPILSLYNEFFGLNCDLKYGLSDKPAPKTQEKLKENLENHMNMIQKDSFRVAKYFKHESIKYAA